MPGGERILQSPREWVVQGHRRKEGTTKLLNDFKQFLLRGNVVDLAVAVIIGAAFGAVVTALVQDFITPSSPPSEARRTSPP